MSVPQTAESPDEGFAGLKELKAGLPAAWYYDRRQYELELARIWYRNWIYVGRSAEVPGPRSYLTFELGDQRLLLVRDDAGKLRGFHNTCRHRGAEICPAGQGTLRAPSLVCPYHAWTYNLQGDLLRTSSKSIPAGFEFGKLALYPVRVTEWRGLIFTTLAGAPSPFSEYVDQKLDLLDRWPLEDLVVAHVATKIMECNWKIFWENFNECLHCPAVHPKLSQLVPLFGRALLRERDDPQWRAHEHDPDPKYKGGLRAGAATFSMDGQITGTMFPGMTEQDRTAGRLYVTAIPTAFIAAHVDYVRIVRLRPLGPERTELRSEYLFAPEALEQPAFNMRNVVDFADLLMSEDAGICEVNQRGVHSIRHDAGVLMPEEYRLQSFHEWIRAQLTVA